jgi:hypothetical protein
MDDVARCHYPDYNAWVRSQFGNPDPDNTFYHKVRLGTKACLEILISWCDGWMTNREHSLEVGGPNIAGHTLLPLNIAGVIQVVKWLDTDERYSPNLSSEVWISMEGCAPYRDIAYGSCAHQDQSKKWYKGNPNSIGWIFSKLPAWFTMFQYDQVETARPQRLVLWMNAQDLNKRDIECPPDEDSDTWDEESERDRCSMGIKISNQGREERDASEATQIRIRLMHGAYMIDDMDKATFESWKNMPVYNLDWCQMNMFIGL